MYSSAVRPERRFAGGRSTGAYPFGYRPNYAYGPGGSRVYGINDYSRRDRSWLHDNNRPNGSSSRSVYGYGSYATWSFGYGYGSEYFVGYRPWYSYTSAYWLYRPWYTYPQSFWLYHPRFVAGLYHVPYYFYYGYSW